MKMPNQYQFKAIGTIHSRGVAYMWACKWQRVKRPVHRGIMLPITLVIVTTAVDTQTVFFFLFFSRAIFFNPSAIALTTFRFCSFKVTVNTCIFCDSDKNYFLSFRSHVGGCQSVSMGLRKPFLQTRITCWGVYMSTRYITSLIENLNNLFFIACCFCENTWGHTGKRSSILLLEKMRLTQGRHWVVVVRRWHSGEGVWLWLVFNTC